MEQVSDISTETALSSPAVKLWSPGFIAGVTFLLGFPAGIVIACINWMRMKKDQKAIVHLVGGLVGIFVFVLIILFAPDGPGRVLGLVVNLVILAYLRQQMQMDMLAFQATNRVEKAGELSGCLIGIGVLILFLGFVFVLAFMLAILGLSPSN